MVVDRCLHKTSQTQVVFDVDVEDALRFGSLLHGPVIEKDLHSLSVALGARNVQGVTSICIFKVDVNVLLEQQFDHIELVLARRNQQ